MNLVSELKEYTDKYDKLDTSNLKAFYIDEQDITFVSGFIEKTEASVALAVATFRKYVVEGMKYYHENNTGKALINGKLVNIATTNDEFKTLMSFEPLVLEKSDAIEKLMWCIDMPILEEDIPNWFKSTLSESHFLDGFLLCDDEEEGAYEFILFDKTQYLYCYIQGI